MANITLSPCFPQAGGAATSAVVFGGDGTRRGRQVRSGIHTGYSGYPPSTRQPRIRPGFEYPGLCCEEPLYKGEWRSPLIPH